MITPYITGTPPSTTQRYAVMGIRVFLGCCLLLVLALEAVAQSAAPRLPHALASTTIGASATLLSDGQWLLLGGYHPTGVVAAARLYDPAQQHLQTLDAGLLQARVYHTATLLPDGQVLVLGGAAADGVPVAEAELFDPASGTFQALPDLGLLARTHHGATLLVDGRVLITGGSDAQGVALAEAELFQPFSQRVERFNARLETARLSHLASLLPNHSVLIWGGVDIEGRPVSGAELYDPQRQQFVPYPDASATLALAELDSPEPPQVVDSDPDNGATEVRGDQFLSVRFSKSMAVTSLNSETVVLIGPDGHVPVRVTPTEGGLVAFVLPAQELLPGADYALLVQGAVDMQQQPLTGVAIGFRTQALAQQPPAASAGGALGRPTQAPRPPPASGGRPRPGRPRPGGPAMPPEPSGRGGTADGTASGDVGTPASAGREPESAAADEDEAWIPGPIQWQGHWRTGRPLPEAVMALLDYEELTRQPIAQMRARLERAEPTRPETPATKRRLADPTLTGVGGTVLKLNDQPLAGVAVSSGQITVRTDAQGRFELTPLAPGHHEITVDGRTVPGGREYLHVIFGVKVRDHELTELPYAVYLPRVRPADWVTVPSPTQEDTVVRHPAWPDIDILRIPKETVFRDRQGKILTRIALVPVPLDRAPYPTPAAFPMYFMLHPGGVLVQGTNARGIQTLYPNILHQPPGTEHVLWFYDSRGAGWTVYGKGHVSQEGSYIEPESGAGLHEHMGAGHSLPTGNPPPEFAPLPDCPCCVESSDGDPVDCSTGLFLHSRTDVVLDDEIPLALTRTYRPRDGQIRTFGKGTNHTYGMYLRFAQSGNRELVELILADGSRVLFPHTGGTNLHADYVWTHTATPSRFYGARLTAPVVDQEGEQWHLRLKDGTLYVFAETGLVQRVVDRNDNRLYFIQRGGSIQRIVTNHGRYIDFQYDIFGCITQIKDVLGRTWTYQYNTAGYLARATYPDATFEAYTYDSPTGGMDTVRDRRGFIMVRNTYDANGRVSRQILADGGVYHFAYTLGANGKVTRTAVTDPRGQVRRREFNAAGYLTRMTRGVGLPLAQQETYERNASHFVTKMTDALGRVTAYQYDAQGNVTRVTLMFGTASATSWSATYEPIYNQMRSATDPLGHTMTPTYDGRGNLLQISDPLAHRTTFTYDALGRPLTASQYVGAAPLTTTFIYDGPDLVQVRDPIGRLVTLTPDAVGRILSARDPLGRLSSFTYDILDRVTTQVDPQGSTTRYTYDGHGNLLTFTDPKNHVTRFAYDARNRLASKTDALLKVESYRYDTAGNLLFVMDRKGQVTGFRYDALHRLIRAGYGATSTAAPVYTSSTTYAYDKGDRLLQVQDSLAGTITRTYDPRFDTITREATPDGTVNYTYDANGLRRTMTPTGGTTIRYGYDAADRLIAITQAAGPGGGAIPAAAQTVTMGYDTADRPTSFRLPNGIQIVYGYDTASQLTSITYRKADATVIGGLTYTYDAAGRRIAMDGSLASSGLPRPFGLAQYDANNRLTRLDAVSYTYDHNGNLLSDGVNTYTWNARDQLVAVRGANTAMYTYDGLGRRRKGTTSSTLYDGWNPIQLKNGTTVVENRLTGLGLDAYYARVRDGAVHSYLTDALGSTLQLRDGAQNAVASYVYDPYGGTAGSANSNLVKYTGREQDFADVYYYRNRYYKPSIGRFISEDPIGLAGGTNPYRYVEDDPINNLDPNGQAPKFSGEVDIGPYHAEGKFRPNGKFEFKHGFRWKKCKWGPFTVGVEQDLPDDLAWEWEA